MENKSVISQQNPNSNNTKRPENVSKNPKVKYYYNDARRQYLVDYVKENYDNIKIRVPKGKRSEYKELASNLGYSLQSLIITLLDEKQQEYLSNNE